MYRLTKEQALIIQEKHVQYYADCYPGGEDALRRKLASITKADLLESGTLYDYDMMHGYVPRAHVIVEELIGHREFIRRRGRKF